MLPSAVQADRWGDYAAAIARHANALGRPAPDPTEPGRNGPRLSPRFVEWLMMLPAGWVTDTPGLSRNDHAQGTRKRRRAATGRSSHPRVPAGHRHPGRCRMSSPLEVPPQRSHHDGRDRRALLARLGHSGGPDVLGDAPSERGMGRQVERPVSVRRRRLVVPSTDDLVDPMLRLVALLRNGRRAPRRHLVDLVAGDILRPRTSAHPRHARPRFATVPFSRVRTIQPGHEALFSAPMPRGVCSMAALGRHPCPLAVCIYSVHHSPVSTCQGVAA